VEERKKIRGKRKGKRKKVVNVHTIRNSKCDNFANVANLGDRTMTKRINCKKRIAYREETRMRKS